MKMHITKGHINRIFENLFPLAVIVVMLAILLSTQQPVKADFTSTKRFLPSPVKEGIIVSDNVFAGITVFSNHELGDMRGGFRIGGLDINIGAIVKTFIDGHLALESQLTLAGNGISTNTITSNGIPGSTIISSDGSGPTLQDVTPAGVNLDGLEGSQGIVVNDARGFTAALQIIQNDRVLSTVFNRASGRRIRHDVHVDITIRNFQQLQRTARNGRLIQRISQRLTP